MTTKVLRLKPSGAYVALAIAAGGAAFPASSSCPGPSPGEFTRAWLRGDYTAFSWDAATRAMVSDAIQSAPNETAPMDL